MKYKLLIFALILMGCAKENRWDCTKSFGEDIVEVRQIPSFTEIYTIDRVDIIYRHSASYSLEVRFGENIIHHIKTDVVDGTLQISNDAKCNWVRDLTKTPEVTIFAPSFDAIENRGTGNIDFKDTLTTARFDYNQWDANGNVFFLLNVDEAHLNMHTGNCRVEVFGRAGNANLYSACSGRMFAADFTSPITFVNNSSIQPMEIYSSGYLYGAIYSRGDILYKGQPDQIDAEIQGSGEIRPL